MDSFGFWLLLGDADRVALRVAARSQVFTSGTVLCIEGEPTTHVFILLSGWVKVTSVTREGREMLEALRGAGDIIGDIAGTVTGYRTATIRALGTVHTLIVRAGQFEEFLDAHPGAAHAHRRATVERQRAAFESQRNQILFNGAQRLARLLIDLADRAEQSSHGATLSSPPLSQEEMASLIGASRSTVTRALHDWRSRRIIQTDQRHVMILDRRRLLRLAGRSPQEPLPVQDDCSPSLMRSTNADH